MTWDRHGEKRPLPRPIVRDVDGFLTRNWRMILFIGLIAFFLIWPFFAPPDVPDFLTIGD